MNYFASFKLQMAQISVRNKLAYELFMDFEILLQMANLLSKENGRRYEALYLANDIVSYIFFFCSRTFLTSSRFSF